jgi:hypothetical protein
MQRYCKLQQRDLDAAEEAECIAPLQHAHMCGSAQLLQQYS